MIQNKTKVLFLGLGALVGTAASIGMAAYAQTPPQTAPAAIVQSATSSADTDNIQDANGVEVPDTNVQGVDTDTETNDDKGGVKDANDVNDNEAPGTEVPDAQGE